MDLNYEEDIESWLGERVGIYPSSLADDSEAVLILEFDRRRQGCRVHLLPGGRDGEEKEYEGATYQLDEDGDAFGVVDDFIVFGDEEGFKKTVDTADGDDTLGASDDFKDSLDGLPEDRLATLYAVPKTSSRRSPRTRSTRRAATSSSTPSATRARSRSSVT